MQTVTIHKHSFHICHIHGVKPREIKVLQVSTIIKHFTHTRHVLRIEMKEIKNPQGLATPKHTIHTSHILGVKAIVSTFVVLKWETSRLVIV